ncbi:UDP-N-acetylmuramoyl-L-alanine--D-glutamate ligase [Qipengyuania sp. DGS5-3]|uniref:UDP-N-acetylmuramoyl-L-alanine--D-glutamate ligase n=1 Tax=Qipengyuania sp. DGS5-3 TaxID=3349632 RepID=UPI0036D26964
MITAPVFAGKRYGVLGLARSGAATAEALLASGAELLVWDDRPEAREVFAGRDGVVIADPLEADLTGYAGVAVSPGVPLNTHPIKPYADSFDVPVIGDIELFAQAREFLPPHKVVGITGTNGKSTTTALTHHILKTAGLPTTMGGNIGLPIMGQDPLPEGGVYVLELSSYQIDLTYSLDCDVAVLLNITPDHLDRYDGDFEKYAAAKFRLFAQQAKDGVAVLGGLAQQEEDWRRRAGKRKHSFWRIHADTFDPWSEEWPALGGPHSHQNVGCATAVAEWLAVDDQTVLSALRTFPGLPHRMERVGEYGGVAYVNDSKATNTAASAPGLAAFDNVHWILGGLAKEPGLGECEAELSHVKAAYTIGKSGPDFAALLEDRVPTTQCGTLDKAVTSAAAAAEPGDTVLLSPACASFDQFRDFEERGDAFRAAVAALAGGAAV